MLMTIGKRSKKQYPLVTMLSDINNVEVSITIIDKELKSIASCIITQHNEYCSFSLRKIEGPLKEEWWLRHLDINIPCVYNGFGEIRYCSPKIDLKLSLEVTSKDLNNMTLRQFKTKYFEDNSIKCLLVDVGNRALLSNEKKNNYK